MTAIIADTWKNLNDVTYNRSLQTVMSSPNTLYGNAVDNTTRVIIGSDPSQLKTYFNLRSVTFTTKKTNSSFLLMGTVQVFAFGSTAGTGVGGNIGFTYGTFLGGIRVLGHNGDLGDSWQGFGHNSTAAGSYSRTRVAIHSPNVPAGTSVTYFLTGAKWQAAGQLAFGGGTSVFAQNGILFSVTELEN